MNPLREAAQQALEALDEADTYHRNQPDQRSRRLAAMAALRAALIREEEASVWLAERKEHWRKEREKAQTTKDQDPELSAALGWPGGISDPVLDRTQLLQMMAALRLAAQQALEACEQRLPLKGQAAIMDELNVLRAALAQEQAEPVQEQAEPVQPGAWVASKDGRVIYDYVSTDDCLLRVSGDFENDEQRFHYAKQIVDKLNASPLKAEPVQEPVACNNTFACQCSKHFASQQSEQRPKRVLTAVWRDRAQRAEAQRGALLEALKAAEPYLRHADVDYNVYVQCRAAIALVEGRVKAVEEGK